MNQRLASITLKKAEHVYALRQSGRAASGIVGNDEADQVRFATALSELGREALTNGSQTVAEFWTLPGIPLQIALRRFPRAAVREDSGLGAARKLLDDLRIEDDGGPTVTVLVSPSLPSARRDRVDVEALRAALANMTAAAPLDELRLKNEDLISTLSELRARRDELERLNAELEETNRGVMAMYSQLAGELEETNRGVVALYAELDDKSARLNDANQAKSRFLASVSHELRSPVNSMLGLLGLLLAPDADVLSNDQRKQLSLMNASAQELLALVNSLLDLAKAESGRLQPEPARFSLGELLSELRGAMRPLLQEGVTLAVELPGDDIVIETDRTLFAQVLRNLIANAIKFTPSGRIVIVASTPTPYDVAIDVRDTGVGIAAEHQSRVFEEFFQVRGPLQSQHKGSGLGLPYARRVAEALGGTLSLESQLGVGTTFTLRVPLHWQPLVSLASTSSQAVPEPSVGTALIIDDDEGFRMTLRGLLQGVAERIVEAPSGYDGLAAIRAEHPDIVFVDLRMPDIDGSEVLAQMHEDPNLRDIPAIIVTSTELTLAARQTLGHAKAMLGKGQVTREKLRAAVASALQRDWAPS